MTPKITIIIPIYNTAPYLRRCLDSVTGQTLRDIEIICVNDASTDNSQDILDYYAAKDARIQVFVNEKNIGGASSRNIALAEGNGEYVAFVDSDDAIDSDFLEHLYLTACATQTDIVKGKMCRIALDGKPLFSGINKIIMQFGKVAFFNEFSTAIYRNSLLKKHNITFPDSITNYEDIVFLARVVLKAHKIECIDNNAYYKNYRRDGSANSKFYSIDKIQSALLAHRIIVGEINNAYQHCITEDEYSYMFNLVLMGIISISNRNDSQISKQICAEAMMGLFNQSRLSDILKRKTYNSFTLIYDFLSNKDVAELAEFLTSNNTSLKFHTAILRKKRMAFL